MLDPSTVLRVSGKSLGDSGAGPRNGGGEGGWGGVGAGVTDWQSVGRPPLDPSTVLRVSGPTLGFPIGVGDDGGEGGWGGVGAGVTDWQSVGRPARPFDGASG